jgi:hypothetical protein
MAKKEVIKEKTKGILLIALGHNQYGRLAYNLATTIKAANQNINISLVHNNSSITHLSDLQKSIFDKLIECPLDYYTHQNKFCAVKSKVYANVLTPYDCTLFLDSDTALMPNKDIYNFINQLEGLDFTIKNSGYYDVATSTRFDSILYGYSVKPEEIVKEYKAKDKVWQVQGEVFYFEKTKKSEILFNEAQKAFTSQKLILEHGFAGCSMNDELAFIIGLIKSGINPHVNRWMPSYWHYLNGGGKPLDISYVVCEYYFLSVGGNNVPKEVSNMYNNIISKSTNALKVPNRFKFENKINYLPERKLF